MNRVHLFRQYGQLPVQKRRNKRVSNVDDLIMQEDLEQKYKQAVPGNAVLISSSYGSRTKTIPQFPSDNSLNSYNNTKSDSNHISDDNSPVVDSGSSLSGGSTKTNSGNLNIDQLAQKYNSDNVKKIPQQFREEKPKERSHEKLSEKVTERNEESPEKKPVESKKTSKRRRSSSAETSDRSYTIPIIKKESVGFNAETVLKKIAEPIRNRLTIDLPLEDLKVAQTQINITLSRMDQDITVIRKQADKQIKEISDLTQNVRDIQIKVTSITQKAEVISGKLTVLDDWMDGLEAAGDTIKMQAIEVFVKFVSYISSLILVIWHSLRMANPLMWIKRRKQKHINALKEESTTDDVTEPGYESSKDSLQSEANS